MMNFQRDVFLILQFIWKHASGKIISSSIFRIISNRMNDVAMYHRKWNAARSGCLITDPLPSGTLEIPAFHLILWDRISRCEETVTPWCITFQWLAEKRDGIARGARTSAGNNSGKRRHIERAKESLPEKSTVRHAGHREKVERAKRTQDVSNSFCSYSIG